ncbi:MAG: DUF3365 domain-containing protein [Planctomycetes bacterium]|nr:DUF3365 domain-containing protein [Planctomycetota bacterium]
MKNHKRIVMLMICAAIIAVIASPHFPATAADKEKKKKDRALERTRETVKMLDNVYKTAVVLITTHYVNDDDDLPAGTAAIALFEAVGKSGTHKARLLDASGEPLEEKNAAKDEFEKAAVKQLKAGESWHEEVIERDGKRYLRAATPIPVVMEKCVMCHDNYKGLKKNEAIGAISYTIQIK